MPPRDRAVKMVMEFYTTISGIVLIGDSPAGHVKDDNHRHRQQIPENIFFSNHPSGKKYCASPLIKKLFQYGM